MYKYKNRSESTAPEGTRDSPGVGLLVAVVQRLQPLLFLLFAEARRVGHFEEGGRELHQPAGVDGGHLPHVLLGGQHQLVIHNPEDERGRMSTSRFYIWILIIYKRKRADELMRRHTTQAGG